MLPAVRPRHPGIPGDCRCLRRQRPHSRSGHRLAIDEDSHAAWLNAIRQAVAEVLAIAVDDIALKTRRRQRAWRNTKNRRNRPRAHRQRNRPPLYRQSGSLSGHRPVSGSPQHPPRGGRTRRRQTLFESVCLHRQLHRVRRHRQAISSVTVDLSTPTKTGHGAISGSTAWT